MKKKRILSLLLSMIVCIAMMPVAVFADGGGGTKCYYCGGVEGGIK